MIYAVIRTGGSIGENRDTNIVTTYEDKEVAKQHARRLNRGLTPGERQYYKIKYSVKPTSHASVY